MLRRMKRLLLALLLLLPLAGCPRRAPPVVPLTIAATTSRSLVVTRPSTTGAPWRLTLVAGPDAASAPSLAPHPSQPGSWVCRWSTTDGSHELQLTPDDLCVGFLGPFSPTTRFFTDTKTAGVHLLPYGRAVSFEASDPPPLSTEVWRGDVAGGALEVVSWSTGVEGAWVALLDGAPIDTTSASTSSRSGRLTRMALTWASGAFTVDWPLDPAIGEVTGAATVGGRTAPLVLRRD
jgi:hypothetical protein